jgi:hypothetical protein
MSVGRRGFLRLLAAAPVAAPVVAREAAQKAGVTSLGLGAELASQGISGPSPYGGEKEWVSSWCREVLSKGWADERRKAILSSSVGRLDPDLASSRSLSLSAAMRMQRERDAERSIANERESARRRYLKLFGMEFIA